MRAKTLLFAVSIAVAASTASALTPRINFVRTIPPPHDLAPAERVAVVYAIGDHAAIGEFVESFVDHAGRTRTLHIENAVDGNKHLSDLTSLRKDHRADVFLGINQFTCEGKERTAEGSAHGADGERVKTTQQWLDAVCTARIDVLNPADGRKTMSFSVRGEGTSPRVAELTEDERDIAYTQAAHYAAVAAAESITPRAVRESIELDANAPGFDEGYTLILSDRWAEARTLWESGLHGHDDSPALLFDLAALSEAMGDPAAADRYLERAQKLQPGEARYRSALNLFRKRRGVRP
jgi:tetratricopeptide (TPR) repeat protein